MKHAILRAQGVCNFSLQYPYIIQQTGNENTQTVKVEVVILI